MSHIAYVLTSYFHHQWSNAMPRALVPGQLPIDEIFWDLKKVYSRYPASKFEHIAGKARILNPGSKTISLVLNDSTSRDINYDVVFITTGSRSRTDVPWKNIGTTTDLRAQIAKLSQRIESADSIVVGGAGLTGLEFAGELGETYAKHGKKRITLVASGPDVLEPRVTEAVRTKAREHLHKLGVELVTDTKVTPLADNKLELVRGDGTRTTMEADLFVPTFGLTFNTDFVPSDWLDAQSRIKVDLTFRVPGHDDVFALGDAAAGQNPQSANVVAHVKYLKKHLVSYFKSGGGEIKENYKRSEEITFGASIGRNAGVGQAMGYSVPGVMIWWFKSRLLGVDEAKKFVAG
jgi:apoptosis-inducing factor 2